MGNGRAPHEAFNRCQQRQGPPSNDHTELDGSHLRLSVERDIAKVHARDRDTQVGVAIEIFVSRQGSGWDLETRVATGFLVMTESLFGTMS